MSDEQVYKLYKRGRQESKPYKRRDLFQLRWNPSWPKAIWD
jgi:hypothetical protein